jgi:hypothetical protein
MLVFIIMVALLVLGVRIAREQKTYGESLENYITSRNPQNGADVDRLTAEYNMQMSKKDIHL